MSARQTRLLTVGGQVQGVGFRPFVYRLAHQHGLSGWVRNQGGQVQILIHGLPTALDAFEHALWQHPPPLAQPQRLASMPADAGADLQGFRILPSATHEQAEIYIPPDYFCCDECIAELNDPQARRYRYPFINCTQCGPRYTLIQALPYDRPHTSMAAFALCPACEAEYHNPLDRRFHAQPLACPQCGPQLRLHSDQRQITDTQTALREAITLLQAGQILAVKGVGGYHLLCDACNDQSVTRLRQRKQRPHKPFAVLFAWQGADGLDAVRAHLQLEPHSAQILTDPQRPIVLLPKHPHSRLSAQLAPGLDEIGALLPYSPLHHLLAADFHGPLLATSANRSGAPVLIDPAQAEQELADICDGFLHHDRPILRPADDSVIRVIADKPRYLRVGRGRAPLSLRLPSAVSEPMLALGGHDKNTVALAFEQRVVISPHIGDLGNPQSLALFEQLIHALCRLHQLRPRHIVGDAHPAYGSTQAAKRLCEHYGAQWHPVYHHHAHAAQLAGEYPHETRWLVFTWDGVGLGEDGTLWGGEALLGQAGAWQRIGSVRPFYLPGGERCARQPWRTALALCWASDLAWTPAKIPLQTQTLLQQAWQRRLNSPQSSAVGRLFDAAAAWLGLLTEASYEAQAPMLLETLARQAKSSAPPSIRLPLYERDGLCCIDWSPLPALMLDDTQPTAQRAWLMHHLLAQALLDQALHLHSQHGDFAIGLSGGVFQNRLLSEHVLHLLQHHDLRAYLPQILPCNDAALSYGQIIHSSTLQTPL